MRLLDLTVRGRDVDGGGDAQPVQVAAILGRTSSRGQQPVVIVWRRAPAASTWSLVQTLGPDSLGGVGVAEFIPRSDGDRDLEARTYRATPGFDEPHTVSDSRPCQPNPSHLLPVSPFPSSTSKSNFSQPLL